MNRNEQEPRFVLNDARQCIEMCRRLRAGIPRNRDSGVGGGLKVILEGLLLVCIAVIVVAVVFMFCIYGKGAAWAVDRAFSVALWAMGAAALLGVLLLGIHLFSRKS